MRVYSQMPLPMELPEEGFVERFAPVKEAAEHHRPKWDTGPDVEAVATGALTVNVKPQHVESILQEGFKNQHATGHSGGSYVPDMRVRCEQDMHGIHKDAPPAERPIYGAITTDNTEDNVRHYGLVSFRLKDDVLKRTTVTHGDSLASGVIPDAALRVAAGRSKVYGTGAWQHGRPTYYEAQIHGGVGRDDIQAARVYRWGADDGEREALEAAGVPYEVRRRDNTIMVQGGMFVGGRLRVKPATESERFQSSGGGAGKEILPPDYYTSASWTPGRGYREHKRY